MSITAADLKFFRAEQPHDLPTGGGRRTSIAVQGGAENNLFPDVPPAFRAAGGVQLRKFFPSVVSEDADVLMQAQVCLASGPADPALDVVLFAFGDQQTTRAQAQAYLEGSDFLNLSRVAYVHTNDPNTVIFETGVWRPGMRVGLLSTFHDQETLLSLAVAQSVVIREDGRHEVTFLQAMPQKRFSTDPSPVALATEAASRPVSAAVVTSPSAAGATALSLNRVQARVVPAISPYPATVTGMSNPGNLKATGGLVPIFRVSEAVRVAGGGLSEVAIVSFIDYRSGGGLEFSAPLVNAYPAGSTVSSLLNLGDLGASVGASFSQQTWTKTFSDTPIGQPIGATYDRSTPIETTNLGAITERWAIIFTSATTFKLVGERVGQVATGTTGAAFAPINPLTNRPYFVIPPEGWGSGWATGNVLRPNTTGAYAPLWAVRSVSPSAPGGLDGSVIEMRGGVNA